MKTQHEVYFTRGQCGHRELKTGEPPPANPGRLQRVTKLMTLAIRFEQLIKDGVVEDQGAIAQLGHVTPARLSQIMGLLMLVASKGMQVNIKTEGVQAQELLNALGELIANRFGEDQ